MLTSIAASVRHLPGGSGFVISTNLTVYIQQSLQWLIDHSQSFLDEFLKILFAAVIMTVACRNDSPSGKAGGDGSRLEPPPAAPDRLPHAV